MWHTFAGLIVNCDDYSGWELIPQDLPELMKLTNCCWPGLALDQQLWGECQRITTVTTWLLCSKCYRSKRLYRYRCGMCRLQLAQISRLIIYIKCAALTEHPNRICIVGTPWQTTGWEAPYQVAFDIPRFKSQTRNGHCSDSFPSNVWIPPYWWNKK